MNLISKLNVATSPHWRNGITISRVQQLWLIALLPALVVSVSNFGINSLRIIALCIGVSVVMDYAANRVLKSRDNTANWDSVVLAILLAMLLPYSAPWWLILTGCFIMIVVGKKMFGGLGAYSVHPVLLSYAMMFVSWPGRFDYTASLVSMNWDVKMIEPVRLVKSMGGNAESLYNWLDLFLGKQIAGIGNGLVLYLLLGGIFLILMRQITWHIPAGFLLGAFLCGWIIHIVDPLQFATPIFHLLSGSTVFGAFFLATESTTSPVNRLPMFIYGLLGGLLLILIQSFSIYNDGVVFTILLINLCHPLLDKIAPKIYGSEEIQNA